MSRLDDAVKGVPADSPAADELLHDLPSDDPDADDPAHLGEGDDDGDLPGDRKDGRSIENVRGELLRKMQKSQQEVLDELRAMREETERLRTQYGMPGPQPSSVAKTLDDLSIAELEAMKGTVPEAQRVSFNEYLQERKIDAKVSERLDRYSQTTARQTAEQRFNEVAVDRWPLLRDKSSEFYRTADRILSSMPGAADNPRAVLDAANEAGLELGVAPSTGIRRDGSRREPGRVAPGRQSRSGPGGGDAPDMESLRATAHKLRDAMPGRKFTEEQLKRIAKRQQHYQDTLATRVRG